MPGAGLSEDDGWDIFDSNILGLSRMNHSEGVVPVQPCEQHRGANRHIHLR